jgi:hypothetical protein
MPMILKSGSLDVPESLGVVHTCTGIALSFCLLPEQCNGQTLQGDGQDKVPVDVVKTREGNEGTVTCIFDVSTRRT